MNAALPAFLLSIFARRAILGWLLFVTLVGFAEMAGNQTRLPDPKNRADTEDNFARQLVSYSAASPRS